jgi:hypothetical protein
VPRFRQEPVSGWFKVVCSGKWLQEFFLDKVVADEESIHAGKITCYETVSFLHSKILERTQACAPRRRMLLLARQSKILNPINFRWEERIVFDDDNSWTKRLDSPPHVIIVPIDIN